MTQLELEKLQARDAQALALVRQVVSVHFKNAQRHLRDGRYSHAATVVANLEELMQTVFDRMDQLLEIDARRNAEMVLLARRVEHYEFSLFD